MEGTSRSRPGERMVPVLMMVILGELMLVLLVGMTTINYGDVCVMMMMGSGPAGW